jgi:hypothetical protein
VSRLLFCKESSKSYNVCVNRLLLNAISITVGSHDEILKFWTQKESLEEKGKQGVFQLTSSVCSRWTSGQGGDFPELVMKLSGLRQGIPTIFKKSVGTRT